MAEWVQKGNLKGPQGDPGQDAQLPAGGIEGQVLTKTADGEAWQDAQTIDIPVPISQGGTGATSASAALASLGAASASDIDDLRDSLSQTVKYEGVESAVISATPDSGQGVIVNVRSSMGARLLVAADDYIALYDPESSRWIGRLSWQ